tara:strand:- start:666 stop:1028 length:363 start_codon:yes stop_codon:yes gene_type:complete
MSNNTKEERKFKQQLSKEKDIPLKYITVRGQDWSIDPEWNKISNKIIQDRIDDLPDGTMYHIGTGKEVLDEEPFLEIIRKNKGGMTKKYYSKGSTAKKKTKKKRPRGVGIASRGYGKAMK